MKSITNSEIVETQFYNMHGVRIDTPSKGAFIRIDKPANGNKNVRKIIIR